MHGVLITPVVGASTRLPGLQLRGTPVVPVDSRSPSRGQCSVAVDDVMGGDLALSHLPRPAHERIAYVAGPASLRQVADRHEGALRALRRVGATADDLMVIKTDAPYARRAASPSRRSGRDAGLCPGRPPCSAPTT